jgi:DNA polymerase-3 subunit delta'
VVGSPSVWRETRSGGESIVAAARRWLMEAAGAPIAAAQRVILIERIDSASEAAQNALLKALEEPNPRQLFVLTAEDPGRVLPTIRSRAQALRLGPVPRDELVAWLVEREHLTNDRARRVARIADGMAGAAVVYARNPELEEWRRRVQGELLSLLDRGHAERFAAGRELVAEALRLVSPDDEAAAAPSGDEEVATGGRTGPATGQQRAGTLLVLDAWLALARDLAVAAAGRPQLALAGELVEGLEAAARSLGVVRAGRAVRDLERIREGVMINAAPRLAMAAAMLAWPARRPS